MTKLRLPPASAERLVSDVEAMEEEAGRPVNVEWCIEANGDVTYVQCRPVANLTGARLTCTALSGPADIPAVAFEVGNAPLVTTAKLDRELLPAFLLQVSTTAESPRFEPDVDAKAFAFRVLHPTVPLRLRNVLLPPTSDPRMPTRKVRAESDFESTAEYLGRLTEHLREDWQQVSLLAERILPRQYTLIVERLSDGHSIEVSRGLCASKPDVPVPRYVLADGDVVHEDEVRTDRVVQPAGGALVQRAVGGSTGVAVSPPGALLRRAVAEAEAMLSSPTSPFNVVELGVESPRDDPSVVDAMGASDSALLTGEDVERGVVCPESSTVVVREINGDHVAPETTEFAADPESVPGVIFVCDRPRVSLHWLVSEVDPPVGFVFRDGSLISHLPVFLRERGVPALITDVQVRKEELARLDPVATRPLTYL